MFFYTSLFIASLIVALVIVWLYNSVADVAKQVYKAILPSSKNNYTGQARDVPLHTTINDTPTPWGWNSHETPKTVAKTHAALPSQATPWGWSGNDREIRGRGASHAIPNGSKTKAGLMGYGSKPKTAEKSNQKTGWPYREEEFEVAGKSYKVTRKVKLKRTNLSTAGKPWGW